MKITIRCDGCGDELDVRDIILPPGQEIIIDIIPCNTKDCRRCEDCEEVKKAEELKEKLTNVRKLSEKLQEEISDETNN